MLNPVNGHQARNRSGGADRHRSVASGGAPGRPAEERYPASSTPSQERGSSAAQVSDGERNYWLVPIDGDARP